MSSDDVSSVPYSSFVEQLAAPTPAPGGGAAAAHVGRLACSLLRMVTGITIQRHDAAGPAASVEPHEAGGPAKADGFRALRALRADAARLSERFARLEDDDAAAFRSYIDAGRLPRATSEEKEARRVARQRALVGATEVPLSMLDAALEALALARKALDLSSETPLKAESDLFAAVELATATFRVAELNLRANLPLIAAEEAAGLQRRWTEARRSFQDLRGSFPAPGEEGGGAG